MSWSARRKFVILFGIGAVGVTFLALALVATLYQAPSCHDGKQNNGEAGIDCGGPCATLCTALERAPRVLFTQALLKGNGRTDVIAEVENQNVAAGARQVPYTLTLYGFDQVLVTRVTGVLDIPPPPNAKVPVYVPNLTTGNQKVIHAFLTIDPMAVTWVPMPTDPRVLPVVSNTTLSGTTTAPRVDAVITNPSVATLFNIPVVVMIRDAAGQVIAASQTIIPALPAQGETNATFTWNVAFSHLPSSIEVLPVISLP